ncbi:ribonuclease Z [Ktedonosporobacter rubrisoli]|uniref:Ribonuclease Z n=1 Tax=Ktedonosporobacter rubrisoli TaxID=2509675 RepID=A0A4P6K148_KTERU|nr:ribonuclease Z [Ktedonosporobacter rubrisoli]QBD81542.1 ribonuclease Z [Ktedonosporobacter rubrisoli]
MSSLILLGTGTCQIEFERRASSVLLDLDNTYILFDCGHGVVQRLLEAGVRHDQVQHIVLSHFHPDHVSDLVPFLQAGVWSQRDPRDTDLHIYGPPGVQRVFAGLADIFGLRQLRRSGYAVEVHELEEGPFAIAGLPFESLSLPPAGNHGLRFTYRGKRYALTGDSHFHEQEIAFLRDVDLAVIDSGHLAEEQIVELAVAAQTKHIICSHLYREIDAPRLQKQAEQRGYTGTISVGRDLLSFLL